MITIKEEARKLLDKFYVCFSDEESNITNAKEFALFHINEIIKEKEDCHKYECYGKSIKHYKKLKQEIIKL